MSLIPISTSTYVNTISTSTVLTLPPASTVSPTTIYYIQDATGNAAASTIYIYTSGSDTIENQTLAFLNANFASIFLASDSISNWMVLQYYASQYALSITYVPGNTFINASVSAIINAPSFTYTFYQNTSATTVGATVFQTIVSSTTSVNTTNTLLQGYYYYFIFTISGLTVTSSILQVSLTIAAPGFISNSSYLGQGQTFNYISNATQSFTVPSYASTVRVSLSGAGGGGYSDGVTNYTYGQGLGGSGALVKGTLNVTPGSTLLINAPSGGRVSANYPLEGWPGGGGAGYGFYLFGSGGGYAAIQFPLGTYLVIAGAGGGAGNKDFAQGSGGNGGNGGLNGLAGGGPYPGAGGTTTGGGAGGSGGGLSAGGAGSFLQGGLGAGGNTPSNGGGGGGGFYGGGGGAGFGNPGGHGGGGGSSLVTGTGFTLDSVITGGGAGQNTNGSVSIFFGVGVTTSWTPVSGASSYILLYYQSPTLANVGGSLFQVITGITSTSEGTSNQITNGYFYYALIIAVNSAGYYSSLTTTPPIQLTSIAPRPTGLPVVPVTASITRTPSAITATWSAGLFATSYTVIFYQNNAIFQVFTGVIGTTRSTTLTTTNGSAYYAVITSVNTNGYSSTSITTSSVLDSYSNSIQTAITGYPGNPNLSFVYPNTLTCTWTGQPATYIVSFYGDTTLLKTFTTTTTSQTFAAPIAINTLYYATITTGLYTAQTSTIQPALYPYVPVNVKLSFSYPTLTVTWSPSQQTFSYSVTIYKENQQIQSFTSIQTTSVSYSATLTGSYYATVQANNAYGFTTVTTPPVQVTMTPVTAITLNISSTSLIAFYTSTNATSYSITFYYNTDNNTTTGTSFNTVLTTSELQNVTVPLYSITTPYYYYAIIRSTNSYGSASVTSSIVNFTLPTPIVTILSEGTNINELYFTWSSTYTTSWTLDVEIQEGDLQIPFTSINGTGLTGGGTIVIGDPVVFIATATLRGPGGMTRVFFTGNTGTVSSTPSYLVVAPSIVTSATISLEGLYAVASWSPAPNTTSYTISFYQGTTLYQTVSNVSERSQASKVLINGYTYTASIISVNSYAFSSAFTTLPTIIIQNPPTPPTNATLTLAGLYILCTWSGALNATSYTVKFYQTTLPQAIGGILLETLIATSTSITNTSILTINNYYYATITSINEYGSSTFFTTGVTTVNQEPPLAPATLTLIPFGFYAKATWPVTQYAESYTVTFYENATATTVGGTVIETFTTSLTTYTSSIPLINFYYYYAMIIATNMYGSSPPFITPFTTLVIKNEPMSPPIVSIAFYTSQLIATWGAATNAVTYTVVFYQVATQKITDGTIFETTPGVTILNKTPTTVPLNGLYYYCSVLAVNTFGSSAATTSLSAVQVDGLLPSTIPTVIMSFAGSQVTASWSAATNALNYTVVFFQTPTQVTVDGITFESVTTTSSSQKTSTLLLNSYYYYSIVTPINTFGYGEPTTSSSVEAQVLPFNPINVSISFSGTQVTVNWTASSYSISYTIVFYQRATPATTGGTVLETTTSSLTSKISQTNLIFRNYYYAIVTGVNQYGLSSPVTTTNSAQAGFTPLVVTNPSISLTTFQAAVGWTASSYTNTYTVRFYQVVTQVTTGGSLFDTGSTALTTLTCTNILLNGYYYYATITSVNEFNSSSPVTTGATDLVANGPTNPSTVRVTLLGNSVNASWTASVNADSYTVTFYQVITAVTTGGTVHETSSTGTTSKASSTTLLNGYYYYATVQAVNAFGTSSIITANAPLLVTSILPSPPSNVEVSFAGTQVTATWTASLTNATSYRVIFYQNNTSSISGGIQFESTTTYLLTKSSSIILLNDYYYYVTVEAVNANGYSAIITSATTTVQITGIAPTNPSVVAISFVGTQLRATWTASTKNAITYTVLFYQVASAVTTGGTLFETNSLVAASPQLSSTILVNGFYYYATVTAINQYTSSSSIASATATALITTILPTAPTNVSVNFAGTQVTASWTASAKNATTYTIRFYQVSSAVTTGGTLFETVTGNTGITQLTSIVLVNGFYYYATVAAINVNGSSAIITSAASTTQITTILPTPPITPTIVFSPNYMTVTWTASAKNATSYTVVFYQNTTSALTGGTLFETDSGISGTSQVTLTALVYNQYYYAIVYGVNTNGSSTGITTSTGVVAAFAPLAPTDVTVSFSGTQVTASWTASSYTSTYTIIFYEVASATTTGGTLFETVTGTTGVTQLTSIVLVNDKYYYATVRSVNPYSTSVAITSSSSTIQITGIFPTNPSNVSITLSGNKASVSWTASTKNTISYTVVIYNPTTNVTTGGTILETATGITSTTFLSTNTLSSGQYYYATVTAINTFGSSSTITSTSSMLASILPTGGAVTLALTSVQDGGSVTITPASLATSYTIYISTSTDGLNIIFSFTTSITGTPVTFIPSPTSLLLNTTYYARVVPSNIYGNGTESYSPGATTNILYSYTGTITFTNATATGRNGPILSQCRTAYSSFGSWVNNTAFFNMTTQGIQQWTVPFTRNYTIVCKGANNVVVSRGSSAPRSIVITATILLTQGEVINILVGQTPLAQTYQGIASQGGSGGSFVVKSNGTALIVAGGIGGMLGQSSSPSDSSSSTSGNSGETGPFNTSGSAGAGGAGGTNGSGGAVGGLGTNFYIQTWQYSATMWGGGGGGGFFGDGGSSFGNSDRQGRFDNRQTIVSGGGSSYSNGGMGGIVGANFDNYSTGFSIGGAGGFGGGGSAGVRIDSNNVSPQSAAPTSYGSLAYGGGGGYSGGGGAGGSYIDGGNDTGGGGGGSFFPVGATISYINAAGNGYVSIT